MRVATRHGRLERGGRDGQSVRGLGRTSASGDFRRPHGRRCQLTRPPAEGVASGADDASQGRAQGRHAASRLRPATGRWREARAAARESGALEVRGPEPGGPTRKGSSFFFVFGAEPPKQPRVRERCVPPRGVRSAAAPASSGSFLFSRAHPSAHRVHCAAVPFLASRPAPRCCELSRNRTPSTLPPASARGSVSLR